MPFTAVTPPHLLMRSVLSGEKARACLGPGTGEVCIVLGFLAVYFCGGSWKTKTFKK